MSGSMDFFGHQDRARKRTAVLVFYFGAAVVAIIAAIYAILAIGLSSADVGLTLTGGVWNTELFLAVAAVVSLVVFAGTSYKVAQLAGPNGGMRVAASLGGVQINSDTSDPFERRLLNVVEEMAIASGTPVPPVYVLDEDAINAFAAGYTSSDAVVAVTRGALRTLTRDELQGVVAHEFSHILNGDMRLNVRLVGILHGIIVLALIGSMILRVLGRGSSRSRSSSRSGKGGGAIILAILLVAITFTVVGYVGEFFARMIQRAVCRQREFLADASAVQFTRNPQSIAGALRKIGGFADGSRLSSANAKTVSHLFFADGLRNSFSAMFSTHPDLKTRISRIDPSWDGAFGVVKAGAAAREESASSAAVSGLAGVAAAPRRPATPSAARAEPSFEVRLAPEQVVKSVGTIAPEQVALAGVILDSIPQQLVQLAHEPFGARAVVFGLLLDRDSAVRAKQLQCLADKTDKPVLDALGNVSSSLEALSARQRLPLLELTLPSLRRLSAAQWTDFNASVDQMIQADAQVSVFEFVLRLLVRRQFQLVAGAQAARTAYGSLDAVLPETLALLSALAWFGNAGDSDRAKQAFANGAQRLAVRSFTPQPLEFNKLDLTTLERALDRLARSTPLVKRSLVDACVACVAADGLVGVEEGELLRAVGSALDCPIPPFAPEIKRAS